MYKTYSVNIDISSVYCCSCLVCVVILCVFVVPCVGIALFFTLDAGLLARSQYSEGPATGHLVTGFFLGFLCLKSNAEMAPKIPSCHYMLLIQPSRLKFSSNQFHVLFTCKITTATG